MKRHGSRGNAAVVVTAVLGIAIGAGAGTWAGVTLLAPPSDVLASPGHTTVKAVHGTVGQSVRLNASVQWRAARVIDGAASGVVTTTILEDGVVARPGDVLYTVGLRPVVVAVGSVPSFRDLSSGVEGEDVVQLQRLLITKGYYVGEPHGVFTSGVEWAVRAWQAELGIDQDGVVRQGDVIYVPDLPARLALDPTIEVGAQVGRGPALQVLPTAPHFSIALAENQVAMLEPGLRVDLSHGKHSWTARVESIVPASETEPARAVLGGDDGDPVCGAECASIPLGGPTLVSGVIRLVPDAEGVVVPAAAVVTAADGSTGVVLKDGGFRQVGVAASANGSAVVEGLEVGALVRVPGEVP